MIRTRLVQLLFLLALALTHDASAQQSPSLKEKGTKEPSYSKEAVLQVFMDDLQEIGDRGPFDAGYTYETPTTRFRWVPFVMPFTFGTTAERVSLAPYVDPFALTGTSFPYTSASYNDRWADWRTRRMLRKNVEAANAADNAN